jgi:hypothetical protein
MKKPHFVDRFEEKLHSVPTGADLGCEQEHGPRPGFRARWGCLLVDLHSQVLLSSLAGSCTTASSTTASTACTASYSALTYCLRCPGLLYRPRGLPPLLSSPTAFYCPPLLSSPTASSTVPSYFLLYRPLLLPALPSSPPAFNTASSTALYCLLPPLLSSPTCFLWCPLLLSRLQSSAGPLHCPAPASTVLTYCLLLCYPTAPAPVSRVQS